MNATIFKTLIDNYNELAYTHNYIMGFEDRGNIYACYCDAHMLPYVCKLDKASGNGGYSLRFRPNKAQKELLKTCKCEIICSKEYFNNVYANCKYNRGEVFEMLLTEKANQTWEKDNVKFTDGADLTIDGIDYQVKFNKATFINEQTLASLTK